VTKKNVNDVYELIMEQRARIEALEAALRDVEHYLHHNNGVKAWQAARAALAPEKK
jgi:hypothetical protein